jgi:thioesterase domain-containing protein
VQIRRGGARPPLVLVAGQSGLAFIYRELAECFSADQPVLALQLIGVDPAEPVAQYSIEEMASVLEPQVVAACGSAPIVLGGYSLGALVAYELAQRLTRRNHAVPLLVSLDGFAPQHPRMAGFTGRMVAHWAALRSDTRAYLLERAVNTRRRVYRLLGCEWRLAAGLPSVDAETNERAKRFTILRRRAAYAYAPPHRLSTRLLLIRAALPEVDLGARVEPCYGWSHYVSDVASAPALPGSHRTLLDLAESRLAIARLVTAHIDLLGPARGESAQAPLTRAPTP